VLWVAEDLPNIGVHQPREVRRDRTDLERARREQHVLDRRPNGAVRGRGFEQRLQVRGHHHAELRAVEHREDEQRSLIDGGRKPVGRLQEPPLRPILDRVDVPVHGLFHQVPHAAIDLGDLRSSRGVAHDYERPRLRVLRARRARPRLEDPRDRIIWDRVWLELPDGAQRMKHVEDAEVGHASYIPGMATNSRTSIDEAPGEWKCGWSFSNVTASSTESASRIE